MCTKTNKKDTPHAAHTPSTPQVALAVHGDAFVPWNIHSYGAVLTGVMVGVDDANAESVPSVEPVSEADAESVLEPELGLELESPSAVSLASASYTLTSSV